ncbi:hypothetical protein CHS0354_042384 [Potamilus streckersoni]|uniref:Uncharacterized protein n=1 Tax=Potamilus streckersoni TaxID=2493646 RepID=A0AAE0SU67_9BIVA|nr:hypothetical protein CHS0354_042384 [Potamilus streckersoni]
MIILNDCTPTRMDPHRGKMSALDLTIITPNLIHDTHDHFPIQIKINTKHNPDIYTYKENWNFKKANWELFKTNLKCTLLEELHDPDNNIFFNNINPFKTGEMHGHKNQNIQQRGKEEVWSKDPKKPESEGDHEKITNPNPIIPIVVLTIGGNKERLHSTAQNKPTSYHPQQHPPEIGAEPQEKKSKRINETTKENKEADYKNKSRKMQLPTTLYYR